MRWAIAAAAAGLLVAGCAGPTDPSNSTATSVTPGPMEVLAVADAQHGEHFDPPDRTVHVGDTLTFKVVGTSSHTVDFGSDSQSPVDGVSNAHSGNLPPGSSFQVTFTKEGQYPFYCQYHLPGMTGHIVVQA